jgi:hypothetical protein
MLLQGLDDDCLLDLYRSLPPGSDLLDSVHSELTRRGDAVWDRIENMFFDDVSPLDTRRRTAEASRH